MENKQIAIILEEIADILDIQGKNPFRIRSYRTAARTVQDTSRRMADLVNEGFSLDTLPGIGKSIAETIEELVRDGHCRALDELKSSLPDGLTDLLKIEGLGPKKVGLLYNELKIDSVQALEKAAAEGRLRDLEGMGEKTEENLIHAIRHYKAGLGRFRLPEAAAHADAFCRYLEAAKGVSRIEPAGSLRRRCETVGDLDLLAECPSGKAEELMDRFVHHEEVADILAHGTTK